jgi:hypothetical protein
VGTKVEILCCWYMFVRVLNADILECHRNALQHKSAVSVKTSAGGASLHLCEYYISFYLSVDIETIPKVVSAFLLIPSHHCLSILERAEANTGYDS